MKTRPAATVGLAFNPGAGFPLTLGGIQCHTTVADAASAGVNAVAALTDACCGPCKYCVQSRLEDAWVPPIAELALPRTPRSTRMTRRVFKRIVCNLPHRWIAFGAYAKAYRGPRAPDAAPRSNATGRTSSLADRRPRRANTARPTGDAIEPSHGCQAVSIQRPDHLGNSFQRTITLDRAMVPIPRAGGFRDSSQHLFPRPLHHSAVGPRDGRKYSNPAYVYRSSGSPRRRHIHSGTGRPDRRPRRRLTRRTRCTPGRSGLTGRTGRGAG